MRQTLTYGYGIRMLVLQTSILNDICPTPAISKVESETHYRDEPLMVGGFRFYGPRHIDIHNTSALWLKGDELCEAKSFNVANKVVTNSVQVSRGSVTLHLYPPSTPPFNFSSRSSSVEGVQFTARYGRATGHLHS